MHKEDKDYQDDKPDLYNAILFKENKNFKITEANKNLIYTNKLLDDLPEDKDRSDVRWGIDHKTNSKKFRSPELKKNTDLLIGGCSFTYGVGIPQEFMWAEIVARDLNFSYANISMPGDSVAGQVKKIFAYFKQYGHPKVLCVLFPEFGRFYSPQNKNHFVLNSALINMERKKKNNEDIENFWEESYMYTSYLGSTMPDVKFSRSPHKAEDVLVPEVAHFYSAQFLLMLEQYCNLAGIKFIWSIWDIKNLKIIKSLNKEQYTGVIDINMENWHRNFDTTEDIYSEDKKRILCHEELREKNSEIFDFGMDRDYGLKGSHWGSHRNQHIADIMKENILKEYTWEI
jgi:hypothetical protein